MFDRSKCDLCGDCLVECHYVDYSREKAIREITALIEGRSADILKDCVTCLGCVEYCEKGADPFDLINSLQEKQGSVKVTDASRALFDHFINQPVGVERKDPSKPVLSLCIMKDLVPPEIVGHKMFEGMSVVWGGEYFCYMGMVHSFKGSLAEKNARAFIDGLAGLDAPEIVFLHDECYSMVTRKVRDFGIEVPFKATHIVDYMIGYLQARQASVNKLNRRIAYQRPCSARLTPELEDSLDEFFSLVGVERVDRVYDRKKALCCGGAIRGFEGQDERGREWQRKNVSDALDHGAEAMVFLCQMCGVSLRGVCGKLGTGLVSVIDLARMSLGEIPFPN
ncbi:MAG: (Fe-S)-binding protein [Proteobacteria bacterium]|nr:(Fe-S)-binding protein [Pseudomonadota bacterium]